jgi:hypothetical protein
MKRISHNLSEDMRNIKNKSESEERALKGLQ